MELIKLLKDNFEDYIRGKSQENQVIIIKLVESLAKDVMGALDKGKKGNLDVRSSILRSIVELIQVIQYGSGK